MPELPEVETIRRGLLAGDASTPSLLEQRVSAVSILWEKTVAYPPPCQFAEQVIGKTIQGVGRRGKFLLIHLEDLFLIFHLRMSGDLTMRFNRQKSLSSPSPTTVSSCTSPQAGIWPSTTPANLAEPGSPLTCTASWAAWVWNL